jgi:hypothetical protein
MIYSKQPLDLSAGWIVRRNEFYDIDPFGNAPMKDKETLIFFQEDILWITNGDYNIDLGWYGGDLSNATSGFYLCLYRGNSWNESELLESFRSRNNADIINKLRSFMKAVDKGLYNNVKSYRMDEVQRNSTNDGRDFSSLRGDLQEFFRLS